MLRDDDIARLASPSSLPNGAYAPHGGWTVSLGDDLSTDGARMVYMHEMTHNLLNVGTTFGSAILCFGAIAHGLNASRAARAQESLSGLVGRSRRSHEGVGTAWGVWSTNADPELLLAPYPGYGAFLTSAREIAPGWPEDCFAKNLAVLHFARVCMQTPLIEQLLEVGFERFSVGELAESELPDGRFALLLGGAHADWWAELEREGKDCFSSLGMEDLFLSQIPGKREKHSSDNLYEFQAWLFDRLATQLRNLGAPVLGNRAQQEQAALLVQMLREEGERYLPVVASTATDPRTESREVLQIHMGERLMPGDERFPATVGDFRGEAVPLRIPVAGGSEQHLFLGVRPVARVLAQYEMSAAARELLVTNSSEEISTAIRTTRVESGRSTVDLRPISKPEDLVHIAEVLGPQIRIMTSVSLHALRTPGSSDRCLPLLQDIGHVTVLIDCPPAALFDEWHDAGTAYVVRPSQLTGLRPRVASLFSCTPTQKTRLAHRALCSPGVAKPLELPACSSPLFHRGAPLVPVYEDGLLASLSLWHLLHEEPWFDFRAEVD